VGVAPPIINAPTASAESWRGQVIVRGSGEPIRFAARLRVNGELDGPDAPDPRCPNYANDDNLGPASARFCFSFPIPATILAIFPALARLIALLIASTLLGSCTNMGTTRLHGWAARRRTCRHDPAARNTMAGGRQEAECARRGP
jgi:hypothetical protein